MNKLVLYRKQLELLSMAKKYLNIGDLSNYIHCVRDAIPDMFYSGSFNLREELIELIPIENLSTCRILLEDLKDISGNFGDKYMSSRGNHSKDYLLKEIETFESIMRKQISFHSQFTVFFSWQSDNDETHNTKVIRECIDRAIRELNKKSEIKLYRDEATKNQPGSPDIMSSILRKIDDSMIFIADVTPITKIDKNGEEKLIPNPNVMCEVGYALSTLSSDRVILICNKSSYDLRNLPFDLGLKRAMIYSLLPNESEDNIKKIKDNLTDNLKSAIRAIRDL